MPVEFFGQTDIGNKRKLNEDHYLCLELSNRVLERWRPLCLLAVADGIGGQAGGGVASSMAIQCLRQNLLLQMNQASSEQPFPDILERSFLQANLKIFEEAKEKKLLVGMGTTLAAALVHNGRVAVSNVGDSRVYLVHEGTMTQISQDHSWAAEQVRLKILSAKDIQNSPFKNLVTRSLGLAPRIEVDTYQIQLRDNDYLLLCTDGLHGALTAGEILDAFKKFTTPEEIGKTLVQWADRQGGQDNITAVVALFQSDRNSSKIRLSPLSSRTGEG